MNAKSSPAKAAGSKANRPLNRATYAPCHTAGPTRVGRRAPMYWATNVLAYWAVPMKRLMKVKLAMPAGSAAANASVEYQERKTRSTKCWMLQLAVLRISGRAIPKNSRYPPAAPHRLAMRPTLSSP